VDREGEFHIYARIGKKNIIFTLVDREGKFHIYPRG